MTRSISDDRAACPEIPSAPVAYSDGVLAVISGWENAPSCGTAGAPASEIARWQSDSVLSAGAVLTYPRTSLAADRDRRVHRDVTVCTAISDGVW
jgi:hypothetical protein